MEELNEKHKMDATVVNNAEYWIGWLDLIKNGGAVLVVVGGAAALIGDWFSGPIHKRLEGIRAADIARLTSESDKARAQIALSGARIAEAEARALQATLELARLTSPRILSPLQQHDIATKLARFSGIKFDLGVVPSDNEISNLLDMAESSLHQAGWVTEPWIATDQLGILYFDRSHRGKPSVGIISATGVLFVIDPGNQDLMSVAEAAAAAFNAAGIESAARIDGQIQSQNKDIIHVLVGRKPLKTPNSP